MTPRASVEDVNVISRVTVASLEDLGYVVDYNGADSYPVNLNVSACSSCKMDSRRRLGMDVREEGSSYPIGLSAAQLAARNYAIDYGKQILADTNRVKPDEGAIEAGIISIIYSDPETGGISSVMVRKGD